jgi:hypothetical protein
MRHLCNFLHFPVLIYKAPNPIKVIAQEQMNSHANGDPYSQGTP